MKWPHSNRVTSTFAGKICTPLKEVNLLITFDDCRATIAGYMVFTLRHMTM